MNSLHDKNWKLFEMTSLIYGNETGCKTVYQSISGAKLNKLKEYPLFRKNANF